MPLKILVTGGAGFIGSHLVLRLMREGHSVKVLDNLATGRAANLAEAEDVELISGDILDAGALDRAMAGAEAVFHVAALPSVPRSWTDPVASLRANGMGTAAVADAAARHGVSALIYSSSSSVYGDQPGACRSEDMTPNPMSPYACSKLIGEQLVAAHARAGRMRAISLRYFNVFGPRQDPDSPYSAVIPKFIRAALRDEPVTIFGDGKQSRDFTYVDNVVAANVLALGTGVDHAVLNVACGHSISLLQLVSAVSRLSGRNLRVEHDQPRTGDVQHSQADIARAAQILRYRPILEFEDGLARTYEHYAAG